MDEPPSSHLWMVLLVTDGAYPRYRHSQGEISGC